MIERWFRNLTQKRIRNGAFPGVKHLKQEIEEYVAHHNVNPKSFVWTAKVEDILE